MAKKKTTKTTKKKNGPAIPFTKDEVAKMIELSMGNMAKAARDCEVPYTTFVSWVNVYGLKRYPDEVKRDTAARALERMKYLAFSTGADLEKSGDKGSVQCLLEIVKRWGKYIEFEEPAQQVEVTEIHDAGKDPYVKPRDLMAQRDESLGVE